MRIDHIHAKQDWFGSLILPFLRAIGFLSVLARLTVLDKCQLVIPIERESNVAILVAANLPILESLLTDPTHSEISFRFFSQLDNIFRIRHLVCLLLLTEPCRFILTVGHILTEMSAEIIDGTFDITAGTMAFVSTIMQVHIELILFAMFSTITKRAILRIHFSVCYSILTKIFICDLIYFIADFIHIYHLILFFKKGSSLCHSPGFFIQ